MRYSAELDAALRAADAAARVILADFESAPARCDVDRYITTPTDLAAQEAILGVLGSGFPGDGFVAEERTPSLEGLLCWECAPRTRHWVIDPIDGSRAFAMKTPEFCVMVALVEGGQVAVGVVHEPVQRRVTWAVAGEGCFVRDAAEGRDAPCHVSRTSRLSEARAAISRSLESREAERLAELGVRDAVLTYSTGAKLALVARGEADLCANDYPEYRDWDLCAADILVREAGGRVTDRLGDPLRYGLREARQTGGFVATNGALHDAMISRLSDAP